MQLNESRAVSSWCNLGVQIQLKDKCTATSPGKGSVSRFMDLVRGKRAELGNHWQKYFRESQRNDKTSPCALCHGHWSYSRVEVKKLFICSLSIKQSWQQFFTRHLNSLINLNPSAFALLGTLRFQFFVEILSVSQSYVRQEVFQGYFKPIWTVIRILP